MYAFGGDNHVDLVNCQVRRLAMKYIGLVASFPNLKNVNWDFVDAKMIKMRPALPDR
jgi:hypothetical protein